MAFRKRYVFIPLMVAVGVILAWFVYAFVWSMRYNSSQRAMTGGLAPDFVYGSGLIRDLNGYYGITSSVNGMAPDTFLLDTQASSLATGPMLERMKAEYRERKPMPNFNFYGQLYFPKLYSVNSMKIGSAELKGALFNEVAPDNGMYDVIYRPIIGRNILRDFIWKIDNDADSVIVFSNANKDMLIRETTGYEKFADGINALSVGIEKLSPEPFMVDLGSDYDIIVDRKIYENLMKTAECNLILSYRENERIDTLVEFTGLHVRIGSLDFRDCSAVYSPSLDRNIIGQRFMGRCNFILGYEKEPNGYNKEDLYLQERKDRVEVSTLVPSIGFGVGFRGGNLYVTLLDAESSMAEAGVKPGVKVLSINSGDIPLDVRSVNSGLTETLLSHCRRATVVYTPK